MADQTSSPVAAAVYIVKVLPENCDRLVERIHKTFEYEAEKLPGFLEAHVLVSDDNTRILVETLWESHRDWSRSRWDEVVQNAVVDLHRSSQSVDLKFYGRREVVLARAKA